jgi:hypothetical protein
MTEPELTWIRMLSEQQTSHGRFIAGDVDALPAAEALGFIRAGLAVQVPVPGQVMSEAAGLTDGPGWDAVSDQVAAAVNGWPDA